VQTLLQQVLPETNDIKHPLEQWQTTNLVLHGMFSLLASQTTLLTGNSIWNLRMQWSVQQWQTQACKTKYPWLYVAFSTDCTSSLWWTLICALVLDLFYATRFASSIQVRNVTWHVYNKLDLNLCYYTHNIIAKRDVITERTNLAHPTISQECLEEFLNHLGANSQNLEPLEVALFNHLKSTSNTPENVQRAARSPW